MIFTPAGQSTWESPIPCEQGMVLLETIWAQLRVGEFLGRTATGAYLYAVEVQSLPFGKPC